MDMDKVSQELIAKANRQRLESMEEDHVLIAQLASAARLILDVVHELDKRHRYDCFPVEDAGPVDPSDPTYARPEGCDGCPIRDFGQAK